MIQRFAYGNETLEVDVPGNLIQVLRPDVGEATESEEQIVRSALESPTGSPRLGDMVNPGESAVVLISDMTRLWVRQDLFLPRIIEELARGGVHPSDITLIAATGDHRGHADEEWKLLLGPDIPAGVRWVDHDARDSASMVHLGSTSRGTEVSINALAAGADRLILTGGIVYHFLAGFSGGMKAILPGVSSYETIMANHSLALAEGGGIEASVSAGTMSGNPCSEDIWEGGELGSPDFLFNVVVDDENHRIVGAVAGDPRSAHRIGRGLARDRWEVAIERRVPVVLASSGGYPKDINLYQTYKTLYGARRAVADGGTVVIASLCSEGMGNDDFARMLLEHSSNREREARLREEFTIGGYMAFHAAVMASECDVILVSGMDAAEIEAAGMIAAGDMDEAVQKVVDKHGSEFEYHMMPSGGAFPVMKRGEVDCG